MDGVEMAFLRAFKRIWRRYRFGVSEFSVVIRNHGVNHSSNQTIPEREAEFMEVGSFKEELQTAQQRLTLIEADHSKAYAAVKELEGKLATMDADHLAAVERAITEGLRTPAEPDAAAIQREVKLAIVRCKAFDKLLGQQRDVVRQLEAQAAARLKQEFLIAAEPIAASIMDAVEVLFGHAMAAEMLCQKYGQPFHTLPLPPDGPSGRGGICTADSTPNSRATWLRRILYQFSEIGTLPKFVSPEDLVFQQRERIDRSARDAERLAAESQQREYIAAGHRLVIREPAIFTDEHGRQFIRPGGGIEVS
jgi:hypothetical protein